MDEAVGRLRTQLPSELLDWILRNPRDQALGYLHIPLGMALRNEWKLWGFGNVRLLASCHTLHAEECTGVIFNRLWEEIRADADPSLVQALDCQFELLDTLRVRYEDFYRLRMGEVLASLEEQIDNQIASGGLGDLCQKELQLVVVGEVDQSCWVRAEFSREGLAPLRPVLQRLAIKNAFELYHAPPSIELRFQKACAWPVIPPESFQPRRAE